LNYKAARERGAVCGGRGLHARAKPVVGIVAGALRRKSGTGLLGLTEAAKPLPPLCWFCSNDTRVAARADSRLPFDSLCLFKQDSRLNILSHAGGLIRARDSPNREPAQRRASIMATIRKHRSRFKPIRRRRIRHKQIASRPCTGDDLGSATPPINSSPGSQRIGATQKIVDMLDAFLHLPMEYFSRTGSKVNRHGSDKERDSRTGSMLRKIAVNN
jgi:hypothetical protein